jgi:hypothetical protein
MYPGFAKQATADNGPAAAALFSELGIDEAAHAKDYTTALNALTNPATTVAIPVGPTVAGVAITAGPPPSSGGAALDVDIAHAEWDGAATLCPPPDRGKPVALGHYPAVAEALAQDTGDRSADTFRVVAQES